MTCPLPAKKRKQGQVLLFPLLSLHLLLYVMVSSLFPSPVLSIASDALKDLDGHDALSGLWTGTTHPSSPNSFYNYHDLLFPDFSFSPSVFTKCKESLQDGRRLENISWRLWYRELAAHTRTQHHLPTPPQEPLPNCPLTPVSEKGSSDRHGKSSCHSHSIALIDPAASPAIQVRVPSPHLRALVVLLLSVHHSLQVLGHYHKPQCRYHPFSRHRPDALSTVAQNQTPSLWARSYAI